MYTQGVETRTLIVLYVYNSCGLSKFLRKNLGKACRTKRITWEVGYFLQTEEFCQAVLFFQDFSRTFFHFQVLSRPGNCHCKNQVHSRISRTRKSPDITGNSDPAWVQWPGLSAVWRSPDITGNSDPDWAQYGAALILQVTVTQIECSMAQPLG